MKIAILAKLRNGHLVELLQAKGWSQADFARAVGVSPTMVSNWMQMKDSPKTPALRHRVEVATGSLCEDLFPAELAQLTKDTLPGTITAMREIPIARLLQTSAAYALPSAEEEALRLEPLQLLRHALAELRPTEREILERRFGLQGHMPQTLAEIGDVFGISGERVKEITKVALQRLQQPTSVARRTLIQAMRSDDTLPTFVTTT